MFDNPFSFKGRIRRKEYLLSILVVFIIAIFVMIIGIRTLGFDNFSPVMILFGFFGNWFMLAQGTKRCHDIGRNGWIQFLPFVRNFVIFQQGDIGPNKYGPDPKGNIAAPVSEQKSTTSSANNVIIFISIAFTGLFLIFFLKVYNGLTSFVDMINEENAKHSIYEETNTLNTQTHAAIETEESSEHTDYYEKFSTNDNETIINRDEELVNEKTANNCPVLYSVQILASAKPIPLNSAEFKGLKYRIDERYFPSEEQYKYKYTVGFECSLSEMTGLKKELAKMGFPGAFIIKIEK